MRFVATLLLFFLCQHVQLVGCTSFIVSGRVTPDGRPIMFKNRDTNALENALAFFNDGKFRYVGLVNCDSTCYAMVWGGFNETGFAIMNTAAYNNNVGDTSKLIDLEGVVMKLALQYCSTLTDFENLLDTIKKPMGVDANFGVIDAHGGAAYYETGNYKYVKFDANDSKIAPDGILIRTNHSFSGDITVGSGYIRYQTAVEAMEGVRQRNNFDVSDLINSFARNLTHSLTKTNLLNQIPESRGDAHYCSFSDYIPRNSTASAILIYGANSAQNIAQTTMWTVLGFPLVSVVVPVFITPEGCLPRVLALNTERKSPIELASMALRAECFPIKQGNGKNYINLAVVVNKQNTGYMQLLKPIENEIISCTNKLTASNNLSTIQIQNHYKWIDDYLQKQYLRLFELDLGLE